MITACYENITTDEAIERIMRGIGGWLEEDGSWTWPSCCELWCPWSPHSGWEYVDGGDGDERR